MKKFQIIRIPTFHMRIPIYSINQFDCVCIYRYLLLMKIKGLVHSHGMHSLFIFNIAIAAVGEQL